MREGGEVVALSVQSWPVLLIHELDMPRAMR